MIFINDLSLLDVDLQEADFTWNNKISGKECIWVRLDIALISLDWLLDSSYSLLALTRVGSNHSPISTGIEALSKRKSFPFDLIKCGCSNLASKMKFRSGGLLTSGDQPCFGLPKN